MLFAAWTGMGKWYAANRGNRIQTKCIHQRYRIVSKKKNEKNATHRRRTDQDQRVSPICSHTVAFAICILLIRSIHCAVPSCRLADSFFTSLHFWLNHTFVRVCAEALPICTIFGTRRQFSRPVASTFIQITHGEQRLCHAMRDADV